VGPPQLLCKSRCRNLVLYNQPCISTIFLLSLHGKIQTRDYLWLYICICDAILKRSF
jgi:hypothetical protein